MINMIPSPKKYEQFDRICRLPCRIYTEVEAFQTGCQVFADAFRTLHGVELAREKGGIELEADPTLAPGEYRLDTRDGVRARAVQRQVSDKEFNEMYQSQRLRLGRLIQDR